MFEQLAPRIDALRQQRGDRIKAAMHRRDEAVRAKSAAQTARDKADQDIAAADQVLKELMDVGENVVIGDQLLTLTERGLVVRSVIVLGII
jgi:hypothetical protein